MAVSKWPRRAVVSLIRAYQKTVSPDHGWLRRFYRGNTGCKFFPSCSEYGRVIVLKRGVLLGVPLMLWRILRCNPWAHGGVDEPL